jgi:hypothetical protein
MVGKREFFTEKGIETPYNIALFIKDAPLLLTTMPEAHVPMEVIPTNVKFFGPTVIDMAPAAEQDAELAAWLKQAPTVLVNLGSLFYYNERRAMEMANALDTLLAETNTQVLWKFNKIGDYGDEPFQGIQKYMNEGRVRLTTWLKADPMSLLATGDIILSVHHGGANCYHEAILAGVPHLVLPVWHDTYAFGTASEYLGIGIWPGRDIAPEWKASVLAEGLLKAITGPTSISLRKKARELAKVAADYGGRQAAAAELAKLAVVDD